MTIKKLEHCLDGDTQPKDMYNALKAVLKAWPQAAMEVDDKPCFLAGLPLKRMTGCIALVFKNKELLLKYGAEPGNWPKGVNDEELAFLLQANSYFDVSTGNAELAQAILKAVKKGRS